MKVENLVKRYNKAEKNAVDGVSFEVKQGEFFTLLGPNGAGKTTTISILTTTLAATSGKVEVAGFEIEKNPSGVRRNIGVIFQNPSLDLNLTAEENVRFHAVLYGLYPYRPTFSMMPKKYQKTVNELADILGIKNEINQPIKTFSGGMKRKLEIVRGLIHQPKILFLDEPTTGLDPQSRQNLWEYLKDVRKKEGLTIFLTTHYLEEAENSDRVCIIDKGKVVSLGTPKEIKKDLVDEYLEIDSNNKESLRKELTKMKLRFEEGDEFKVWIKNDQVQSIMKKLETKLTSVKLHSPTLEEAYLNIISQGNNHENT